MQFSTFLLTTLAGASAAAALPDRGDSTSTIAAPTPPQGRPGTTVDLTLIANKAKSDDIPVTIDVIKGDVVKIDKDSARDFTGIQLEDRGLARLVRCQGRGDNGATTDSFGFEDGDDDDANVLALGAFILRTVVCELKDPNLRRLGSSGAVAGGSS